MNPYENPKSVASEQSIQPGHRSGRKCLTCGSTNLAKDMLTERRPSIFYFLLFGWFSLLVGSAFRKRSDLCEDCGALSFYRTPGSYLAITILIALIILLAVAVVADPQ
jgi:hypothetical protein